LIYGFGLAGLGTATLTAQQLSGISRVLEIPEAPCAIVLELDRTSRLPELIRQLYNPACDALEWKQIALGLAQFTGRAFATGDLLKPSEIEIDFPKLCDYLVRRQLNFPADDN
jgi:hypothetical protein